MIKARFYILIAAIAVAEMYSYILVNSFAQTLSPELHTAVMSAYLLISLFSLSTYIVFRKLQPKAVPNVVQNVMSTFAMGLWIAKIAAASLMLVDDGRRLAMWAVEHFSNTGEVYAVQHVMASRSVLLEQSALLFGGLMLGTVMYGMGNRYRFKVKHVQLKFDHLPESFKGMKMVQISDIHSGSFDSVKAIQRGVDQVMAQKPDIIFFTGDLVNDKAEEIEPYKHVFAQLNAPLGVFSILGNHDYGDHLKWKSEEGKKANLEALIESQEDMGWRLLMNEHVVLERNGEQIALAGIENWGAKAGFMQYGNMQEAYRGLHEKNVPFKILLSHDPSHWDHEVIHDYKDIDLTLSGHTHGMQFGIETRRLKWSPAGYVYKKWAGLYREGEQYLYVNRGFGFMGYPGRLGIMPEITVIELV